MSSAAREQRVGPQPGQEGFGDDDLRRAVFDALVDGAAIVDEVGVIVHVNASWQTFAALNEGDPATSGVGVDYLAAALAAAEGGDDDAAAVAAGLHEVLSGRRRHFEHRYPCPSPIEERWFVARIAPLAGGRGALVTHLDVTEMKQNEDRLAHEASHDPLTDLPNRDAVVGRLRSELARAGRSGEQAAVLFLDLDGFKPVNDRYGHEVGDRLLVRIAARLRRQMRTNDVLGRVGGDEFVAVCAAADAVGLAERLRAAVREPLQVGADSVVVGVSIGIAVSAGDGSWDAAAVSALLAEADRAMYADKASRTAGRRGDAP